MRRSKGFLLLLVSVLLVLTGLLMLPFLQYVLAAVLIAFVLYPLQIRLERHLSSMVSALVLVCLAIAGFVAPFLVVIVTIAGEADRILRNADPESFDLAVIESRLEELTGREIDVMEELAGSGQELGMVVFERSTEVFSTAIHFFIGLGLVLFLIYYLLKDGDELITWLYETIPLPDDLQRDLSAEIDDVMWAVLFGHVFVAIVQGVVAGLGLFATGVPNAMFWTAVMVVLAMVPLVGAIPVWGGAVVYLYLSGEPVLAILLLVYSVVVVGLTDDYLRPFAVNRYARLNPAVILLGILGGAYAFGIMGLFFGPVILGALKATLHVLSEHWHRLDEESPI